MTIEDERRRGSIPATFPGSQPRSDLMTAPVSPIATQETPEVTARRIAGSWGNYSAVPMLVEAIKAERSSAERRVEELGRERAETERKMFLLLDRCGIKVEPSDGLLVGGALRVVGDQFVKLSQSVTTLKAEVEELKRKLTKVLDERATLRDMHEAAESRLASLTGQVEDMRERAAKQKELLEWVASRLATDGVEHLAQSIRNELDFIRSLPVLPTTGDGGETP